MNTAYYTLSTWGGGAMAAGFDGTADAGRARPAAPRRSGARGGDNVIDLNAWRAANLEAWADGEAYAAAEGAEAEEPELSVPAPRPRKSRRAALLAEAASTVCVAAAALAIILRVVAF